MDPNSSHEAATGITNPSYSTDSSREPSLVKLDDKDASPKNSPKEKGREASEPSLPLGAPDTSSPSSKDALSGRVGLKQPGKSQDNPKESGAESQKGGVKLRPEAGKGCKRIPCCQLASLIFGSISSIVGLAMLAGGYNAMFDAILKTQMEISPGSLAFDIWKDTPVPLSISFYLYNLTNPVEFENGEKAILDEVGPYVYQEFHKKTGIDFNSNSTVTFFQKRWWTWDQEASGNLTEDDSICILNTVPVSAAYSVAGNSIALGGLNWALNLTGEELTLIQTVRDILFDGYQDPLLDYVQVAVNNTPWLIDWLDLPPGLLNYDRMGWFYKRNESESYDGEFNMFTGEDTLDKLGKIDWWDRTRDTDFFGKPCNHIWGSAGELWPPYQQRTNITFYSTDLCMTLTLQYKEDIVDSFGLEGYRYWADDTAFGDAVDVPVNQCYCFTNDTCPVKGLLDAQTCRMGSPAFISFPHFLHADPSLLEAVEGVTPPVEELHQMNLDMIPELGVPISVKARMQINMGVASYPGFFGVGKIDILANVQDVILPLLWFEVSAALTDDLAQQMKPVLFLMRSPAMTILWSVMVVAGLAALGTSSWALIAKRRRQRMNVHGYLANLNILVILRQRIFNTRPMISL